jgi:hypothetical protein
LIEEITPSEKIDIEKPVCPKYTLECCKDDSGTVEDIKVRITLDGVFSVKECCLDISQVCKWYIYVRVGLWCFNATLKNNISVFRGGVPGENRQTCHKSLTNFIT